MFSYFVYSLIALFSVVCFGGLMVVRMSSGKKVNRLMKRLHGASGALGVILLLMGLVVDSWESFEIIAAVLFMGLLVGAFFVFEVWFKDRKTPMLLVFGHGTFAVICIGVLAYSLFVTGY